MLLENARMRIEFLAYEIRGKRWKDSNVKDAFSLSKVAAAAIKSNAG